MNKKNQETVISRIMLMLVGCALLILGIYFYVIPYRKTGLQINYYYRTVEYITMGVTALLFIASLVYAYLCRKKDMSNRVITPTMLSLLSGTAFVSAAIVPIVHITFSRFAMAASVFVFLSYATYHLVDKTFAYHTSVCGIYFIALMFFTKNYSRDVTFADRFSVDINVATLVFALAIAFIMLISVVIAKKKSDFKLYNVIALSFVPTVYLIVRNFVIDYVDIAVFIALSVIYIAMIIVRKMPKKTQ